MTSYKFFVNRKLVLVCSLCMLLAACSSHGANLHSASAASNSAKNIIFFIGDGMGLAQVSAAILQSDKPLNIQSAQAVGLINTRSAIQDITDSAAGATAFATGVKTVNDAVGVDVKGAPRQTILELLAKDGYATGLIATSTITHATPASFYAHVESRSNYYKIAEELIQSPVTLFIGGGRDHFIQRKDATKGQSDQRNLLDEFTTTGATLIDSIEGLKTSRGRVGYFIAGGSPESLINGRDDVLVRSIEPSIDYLRSQNSNGFMLVVEGSQIDWGGHENKFDYANSELMEFDEALGKALAFAQADGETLVLVTADHETGGLTLSPTDLKSADPYAKAGPRFSTIGHTAVMVPVYAFGKGAEHFSGVYENNEIYFKMLEALGRKQPPTEGD